MKKQLSMALAALTALTLAACATKDDKPVPVEDKKPTTTTPPPATGGGATTTAVTPPTQAAINPLKDPNNVLSKRIIYFEYDKDAVKPEFQALVQAHARFLNENRNRKVKLEGHADERGSREYNMALGQRRADAVRKALNLLGVASDRIETVSFGEDKPRVAGATEEAWAQNRRVEIVYDGE
jgi:peptidoglycan-associated lipoprotein